MLYHSSKRLILQFHITGKCNLHCKHCYRTEGDVEPLTLQDVRRVIDQFLSLLQAYNSLHGLKKRGHINITGGEPFSREDIKEILQYLAAHASQITYGVLTNGSYLNRETIALLKQTNVSFVQLSIDGNEQLHDRLRAAGDYKRVFSVAQLLVKSGIRTYISFTANKRNMRFLPAVARECRKRRIHKLWSDRLVPIGNGKELRELEITEKELPAYLHYLKKAQGNQITKMLYPKTEVALNRALQFLNTGCSAYSCAAGKSLITVDEFGNIMPCRRMPIICDDVFSSTLEKVYFSNPVLLDLRKETIPRECSCCEYSLSCMGGAKCQSFAKTGDYTCADPACPKRKNK